MNSVKNLIFKALNAGQISEQEFKIVLNELDKYNDLKDKTHTEQSGLSKQEKKVLINIEKAQTMNVIQKNKGHIILLSKFVFVNDPSPIYKKTSCYLSVDSRNIPLSKT